jgi:Trypsin-co-occurring domain 1
MATKLIELADGTLIEIEVPPDQAQPISGGLADKVNTTLNKIQPVMINLGRSLTATWHEINEAVQVEQAELEFGLSFEAEGNLYITTSKTSANLTIRLVLKPKK